METTPTVIGYLWAAILGITQGVTEFLPVSSSGHLALVQHLGLETPAPAALDVILHLATLLVVIHYFRRTILWYYKNDRRVLLYVLAATVPTGVVGLLFKKSFEAIRLSPTLVCLGLLVTAAALAGAHFHQRSAAYQARDLGWLGAVTIGLCQALALVPGISRSGSTISGAVLYGIDRDEAFNFSFILSIPAVLGAVFLHALDILKHGGGALEGIGWGPLALGFVLAAASGYAALKVLDAVVSKGRLVWFAGYCAIVGVLGLVYFNLIAK